MFEKIKSFLVEKTNCDPEKIELNAELSNLGIDSLQFLMLINDFEEEFKIRVEDDDLEKIHTIQDLMDILKKNEK